ncbi:PA3496 family putative envelope integrity protein [Halomonas colorata]|uniref:Uncharacterized protein n=1 Tax=Halomonas colorata TaxID=2742615 RepID=A0ABR9FW37_9GAMM|nr:hypothetical protein [Halomonas colorata]MBE0462860.1 hypothetical protein [Halomonas colorata]
MKSVERITSVKSELLDIFMSMEVDEHAQRQRNAAQRNLRARRGIELHREFQKLYRDIAPLPEEDERQEGELH